MKRNVDELLAFKRIHELNIFTFSIGIACDVIDIRALFDVLSDVMLLVSIYYTVRRCITLNRLNN